jgi:hypothetical protein
LWRPPWVKAVKAIKQAQGLRIRNLAERGDTTPVLSAAWEQETGESWFKANWSKISMSPYLKNKLKSKRDWDMAQAVENLSNKHETKVQTPILQKNPKNKKPELGI